ncbi:hypothetical protein SERLA73DRAFT_141468, partial [Serpula lacrymans var. lacrymans S7.3]
MTVAIHHCNTYPGSTNVNVIYSLHAAIGDNRPFIYPALCPSYCSGDPLATALSVVSTKLAVDKAIE